ncbi:MAG TPA: CpaF family protein, partial [Alcaligenes faecalis]|nr:CpaF family protein [Alcaligenes faecalis]
MNNTSLLGGRPDLIQVREQAHEHLLARIEELGAEFGRWTRQAIQDFVG